MRRRLAAAVAALSLAACWLTTSFEGLVSAPDAGDDDSAAAVDAFGPDGAEAADVEARDAPADRVPPGPDATAEAGDAGCVVSPYAVSVSRDKPVAYYRLDEDAGATVAKDTTGHYNGTYTGNVTLGAPGIFANDTAASFDGTNAYVRVGPDPSFTGVTPFSVELWIYPTALDAIYRGVLSNETTVVTNRGGYLVFVHQTGDVGFERWGGGQSNPTIAHTLATGAWFHVVGTFNGTKSALYLNGVEVDNTTSQIVQIPAAYTFVIGALLSGTADFFQGRIDEVAIYDHALDPRCVLAHYHLGTGQAP
jgi:Concanavalin A-like lectin/glucanases superfamily